MPGRDCFFQLMEYESLKSLALGLTIIHISNIPPGKKGGKELFIPCRQSYRISTTSYASGQLIFEYVLYGRNKVKHSDHNSEQEFLPLWSLQSAIKLPYLPKVALKKKKKKSNSWSNWVKDRLMERRSAESIRHQGISILSTVSSWVPPLGILLVRAVDVLPDSVYYKGLLLQPSCQLNLRAVNKVNQTL